MRPSKLFRLGVVGTLVAALCCFTPVLTILLTAVGAAAAIGYLDYVLLPGLAIVVAIAIYALVRQRRAIASAAPSRP